MKELNNMKHIKLFEDFLNEGISVSDERPFGKKGIIIMIDDNGKKVSAIFKDKKNADKFNRNDPSDVKNLLQLAKKTKFPKAIDESVNEGTWSIGTAEAVEDMIGQLEGMLKLKDCKKILKALDKKFYDRAYKVLGDDSVHDYLAAIERECDGIGNLKAAHAEIENAIERSKVLLKNA